MVYNDYQYLFPPRPETAIPRTMLGFYQKRGFLAQKKKNGTCCVIFACGDRVIFKTRHGNAGEHKLWVPQPDHIKFFQGQEKWNVFVAEVLHSKVSGGPKNQIFLFDQIVRDGIQLLDETYRERQIGLLTRFAGGKPEDDQYRVADRISLAKNFSGGFGKLFDSLKPEDEGLVLKDPNAKLRMCFKADANKMWQVKCRISATNYSF